MRQRSGQCHGGDVCSAQCAAFPITGTGSAPHGNLFHAVTDHAAIDVVRHAHAAGWMEREVGVVLGGPYNSGILATGSHPADGTTPFFDYAPASPDIVAHVTELELTGRAHGVPLKAAALQFPRVHPCIATVLAGARSVSEIDENVAMARFRIPPAYWAELRQRGLLDANAVLPGSTFT